MSRRRPAWTYPVAAFLGAWVLRLWRLTWRVGGRSRKDVHARRAARGGGPGTVYLVWHSRILIGAPTFSGIGLHVLISLHGDGEYIARTVDRMGFVTIRGSTTRGGARALREVVDVLRSGGDVIVTPDGPRGPRFRVQQGCVAAAALAGAPIVPVAFEIARAKRLRSWDRFVVPGLFTRVLVAFGEPIDVPADLDAAGVETWRLRAERAMHDLTRRTAEELGTEPETAEAVPGFPAAPGEPHPARRDSGAPRPVGPDNPRT